NLLELAETGADLLLEPAGKTLMKLRSLLLCDRSVSCVADEDVTKPVGGLADELGRCSLDELTTDEPVGRSHELELRAEPEQGRSSPAMKQLALDRAGLCESALVAREQVEAGAEQGADRRRHANFAWIPHLREPLLVSHQGSLVDEHCHKLLGEEWVACGSRSDLRTQ